MYQPKDNTVNIKKLHPMLKKRLKKLDKFHKQLTGTNLVVTSGNDGDHKPDSLHYEDKAVDLRRWYIDSLPESEQGRFFAYAERTFPNDIFDFVEEDDHFHLELDPKFIKDDPHFRPKKPKVLKMKPIVKTAAKKIDGKKTITGLLMILAGGSIIGLQFYFGLRIPLIDDLGWYLLNAGLVMAFGIGIPHKLLKWLKKLKRKG